MGEIATSLYDALSYPISGFIDQELFLQRTAVVLIIHHLCLPIELCLNGRSAIELRVSKPHESAMYIPSIENFVMQS